MRASKNRKFETANETIVGENIEVDDEKIKIIIKRRARLLKELNKEKVFVSSTIYNLTDERMKAKQVLYDKGYYPIMSEQDNFQYGPNDADSHDHCIDELLKCKQMICIIGCEYGGIYAGDKYKNYIEEIRKESGGRIQNPSISLMEFYIGRKKGLKYRIFVKGQVIEEKKIYDSSENKNEFVGKTEREVFTLINFINHIKDQKNECKRGGNWLFIYDSIDRLAHQLSGIDFIR